MGSVIMFLILLLIKVILATNPPRVNTQLGVVEGYTLFTYTNKSFYGFDGVPYAQPPVGYLRYENPRDPLPWYGILQARIRPSCYQLSNTNVDASGNYVVQGEEDCLYLNIYTPTLNQSANLDVIVHIHGGAFMFGQGTIWGPEILLNRPVVYVSLNYRVGPLGFLSTEDNAIPGNIGLRDQQQALKWIKKLIKNFGGNPQSITIHGLSAGGSSVHLHYLLPGSKGLFNRGIAQSGVSINNWVLMENPLEKTKKLAELVGCPTTSTHIIKYCLKTKHARLIVESVRNFMPFLYNPFSPWAIVVDGNWTSDPVLPEHPLNLLRKGKVQDLPLIASFVSSEGLYPGDEFYTDDRLAAINSRWNEVMPHIMMYNETVEANQLNNVSQIIRQENLGNNVLNKSTYSQLIQAMSDRNFVADIEKAIRLHSAAVTSPIYSYYFNYRGNTSLTERFTRSSENIGVSHGDDAIYIVKVRGVNNLSTQPDIAMSNLLLDMIMSFINSGVPNITSEWNPLSKNITDDLKILQINRYDELIPQVKNSFGKATFWKTIAFNENERLLGIPDIV